MKRITELFLLTATTTIVVVATFSCTESPPAEAIEQRTIEGVGDFKLQEDGSWIGTAQFNGVPVEVELEIYGTPFDQVAGFARALFGEYGVNENALHAEIEKGLKALQWKFERYGPVPEFSAHEFHAKRFYIYWNPDKGKFGTVIGLEHTSDRGHWAIDSHQIGSGVLNWTPQDFWTPQE